MIRNRDLMATPPYYISAYGIWLKLGNQGTEQDFIDSLQGADGEKTLIQYNGATGNLEWKHENGESWAVLLSFTDIISQGEADVIAACLTHANTAQLHSETAAGYAEDAQGYASAASASKTAAESSAASAASHANNASASETAAAGSVAAAAGSASTAASKANEAAASAAAAQNSVSAAAAQASAAAGSAASAGNSADAASGSAASASGYASAASTSAGEAAASAAAAQAAASGMLPTNYEALTNKPSIGGTTLSGALTLATLKIQAELVAGTNVTLTPRADGKVTISAAGGSGGTSDYTALTNKPQINSVELSGNKSLTDLGIASATALAAKQDKLTAGTNITISGTTISANDTKDYNALSNRPQIAGVTLSGDKTLASLGIAPAAHTHPEYAAAAHNHDSSYAAAAHAHAGYAQVLMFQNISVAASVWGSDATYTDYPFSATVSATGVTADYLPEVIFGAVEAAGGSFAPVALSGAGTVKIYAKAKPTATITIPSILCTKAVT